MFFSDAGPKAGSRTAFEFRAEPNYQDCQRGMSGKARECSGLTLGTYMEDCWTHCALLNIVNNEALSYPQLSLLARKMCTIRICCADQIELLSNVYHQTKLADANVFPMKRKPTRFAAKERAFVFTNLLNFGARSKYYGVVGGYGRGGARGAGWGHERSKGEGGHLQSIALNDWEWSNGWAAA
ncbi:hypothetical protein BC830DRAFT_1080666 [Chytriomyces sp. MP71]|nr:hypothetical protein BC830DRAFT_1080666 [Chytriomyces sp. MP71]